MKGIISYLLIVCFLLICNSICYSQRMDNHAATFNGTSSYIAVPDSPELNPTTAITIEAWVYPTSYTNYPTIMGKNYSTSYWLGISTAGKLRFYPKGLASSKDASVIVPLNVWSHVAATYDGAKIRLLLNGVVTDSSTTVTGALTVNIDSLYIGVDRNVATKNYFFPGKMDNVRLWNVARTPEQIRSSMFIPLQIFNPSGNYTGLAASYQFDDSNGGSDWSGTVMNNGIPRNVTFTDYTRHPVYFSDFNNALSLDGNSYCALENHADFNASTAITLEAWIKRDLSGTQPLTNPVVAKSSSGRCDYVIFLQTNPSNLYFQMNNPSLGGTNTVSVSTACGITDDAWHHVAATYNSVNGQVSLYVDGNKLLQSVITGNPAIPNNMDSLYVGTAEGYTADHFKGLIDEVRIWKDIVRTEDEIKTEMFKSRAVTSGVSKSATISFDGCTNYFRTLTSGIEGSIKFRGNAVLSSPKLQNTYSSPILFNGITDEPTTFIKSNKHIAIAAGTTIVDSLNFPTTNVNVSNSSFFVLLNHGKVGSISMNLISPAGVSVSLLPAQNTSMNGHDIMTFFTMAADSTINFSNSSAAPFSLQVKPANELSAFAGSRATGFWKLRITDNSTGTFVRALNGWGIKLYTVVGVDKDNSVPGSYSLCQNYPNPFNPSTKIKFTLPKTGFVKLEVYNILGEKIQTLVEKQMDAGNHEVMLNASNFSSGVYLYKISAGSFQQAKKMILLK